MLLWTLQRAIQAVLVLAVVLSLLFVLLRLSGDPARMILGDRATLDQVEQLRQVMGLDRPLHEQYLRSMWGVARLDFGESFVWRRDALSMVWRTLPNTLLLSGTALLIGLAVALPAGIYAALRRGTSRSSLVMLMTLVGQSVPAFWMGIILILLFAVQLRWLPAAGFGGPANLVLPALTLSAPIMARQGRLIRSGLLDVVREDYMRTGRAKGLDERTLTLRHALKNALIPVVTVLAVDVSLLVSGSVIVESIFAWPGMGRQMLEAVNARDYPVVQATVFVVAALVLAVNFLLDLLYRQLDPRIRVR